MDLHIIVRENLIKFYLTLSLFKCWFKEKFWGAGIMKVSIQYVIKSMIENSLNEQNNYASYKTVI